MTTQHIILPYCWVCNTRFTHSDPPGPAEGHVHHVIPRAYGGVDGPTVSLCTNDHTKTHAVALCLIHSRTYHHLMRGESPDGVRKLLYMATCIRNAELVMRNDPNKAASAMVVLDARHKAMVEDLKKVYPKARSREAVLLLGLETLHKRHFTK